MVQMDESKGLNEVYACRLGKDDEVLTDEVTYVPGHAKTRLGSVKTGVMTRSRGSARGRIQGFLSRLRNWVSEGEWNLLNPFDVC